MVVAFTEDVFSWKAELLHLRDDPEISKMLQARDHSSNGRPLCWNGGLEEKTVGRGVRKAEYHIAVVNCTKLAVDLLARSRDLEVLKLDKTSDKMKEPGETAAWKPDRNPTDLKQSEQLATLTGNRIRDTTRPKDNNVVKDRAKMFEELVKEQEIESPYKNKNARNSTKVPMGDQVRSDLKSNSTVNPTVEPVLRVQTPDVTETYCGEGSPMSEQMAGLVSEAPSTSATNAEGTTERQQGKIPDGIVDSA